MRRSILLLAMMLFGLIIVGGVALAATITCGTSSCTGTNSSDTLNGNTNNNRMAGGGGNDTVKGVGGNDFLFGDQGDDTLQGGNGSDFLNSADFVQGNDTVDGGAGINICVVDKGDLIADSSGNTTPAPAASSNPGSSGTCTILTVVGE